MLGTDKSRGYCLEMICADFLAGAGTQGNQSDVLVVFLERLFKILPDERKVQLVERMKEEPMGRLRQKRPRLVLNPEEYDQLRKRVLNRDGWKCQSCGTSADLQVHHIVRRSQLGPDAIENLMTLCAGCHRREHIQSELCLSR